MREVLRLGLGTWLVKHPARPTLGIQCLAPSGGTIASILRGNMFFRHFAYADIWYLSFCEVPASRWWKGGTHLPRQHWGLLQKGNPHFLTCSCKHLQTVLLWPVGPLSPHLAANGWMPQSLPAWVLPSQDRMPVWPLSRLIGTFKGECFEGKGQLLVLSGAF